MARKNKKSVEAQFDENGNPIEVGSEEKVSRAIISDQTIAEIQTAMMYCSRNGNTVYDKGEWGSETFTVRQVEEFAERMGVECDNKQVRQVFAWMVKGKLIGKMDLSRKYFYNSDYESELQSEKERFQEEVALRPIRR